MAMNFEELDETTRHYMLGEFEAEEAGGHPYRSPNLNANGLAAFPDVMRSAIQQGNEQTLADVLNDPSLWNETEPWTRLGVPQEPRRINVRQQSERLALTEFNTWYVRGLSRRLLEEGVAECEVFRGEEPKWEPAECAEHEGLRLPVQEVYDGHRARYWPTENPEAISVPFGPNCHHTIRRVS